MKKPRRPEIARASRVVQAGRPIRPIKIVTRNWCLSGYGKWCLSR
jgi:hypothetical protein